jgi:hypothetical protein
MQLAVHHNFKHFLLRAARWLLTETSTREAVYVVISSTLRLALDFIFLKTVG